MRTRPALPAPEMNEGETVMQWYRRVTLFACRGMGRDIADRRFAEGRDARVADRAAAAAHNARPEVRGRWERRAERLRLRRAA